MTTPPVGRVSPTVVIAPPPKTLRLILQQTTSRVPHPQPLPLPSVPPPPRLPDPITEQAQRDRQAELNRRCEELSRENADLKAQNERLKALIKKKSQPLLRSIADDLLKIIKKSKPLQQRLDTLLNNQENMDLRKLIPDLDREISEAPDLDDDWYLLENTKNPVRINAITKASLVTLQEFITTISEVVNDKGDSDKFTVKLSELMTKTPSEKTHKDWTSKLWNLSLESWMICKGLMYVGRIGQELTPSLVPWLQFLFPPAYMSLLGILIKVIHAAEVAEEGI